MRPKPKPRMNKGTKAMVVEGGPAIPIPLPPQTPPPLELMDQGEMEIPQTPPRPYPKNRGP